MKKGNLKNESDTRCQSNNQKWFDQGFNNSIQMSQWPVHIKAKANTSPNKNY